jgi:hypothetical protein
VERARVRSSRRLDYQQVDAAVAAGGDEQLTMLRDVGTRRVALARARGAVQLPSLEEEVELDAAVPYLLGRWDRHGHNPISRALTSLGLSEEMRQRVASVIAEWLRHQLGAELAERDLEDAELRAELIVAIAAGVAMTRANGTLEKLAAADRDDVAAVLAPAIERLVAPPPR